MKYRSTSSSRIFRIALIAGVVFVVVFGVVGYAARGALMDWFRQIAAPALPTEEAYHPATTTDGTSNQPASSTPQVTASTTKPTKPAKPSPKPQPAPTPTSTPPSADPLPAEKRLAVPFLSQAPYAKWDAVHEETCEEASILMVRAYYQGKTGRIDPAQGEKDLQSVVSYELKEFGFYQDTTAAETARLVEGMFPELQATVVPFKDADQIKRYVAAGTPVIIPADGKLLPNPNFSNGGPPYHMLVVRGYTADRFITNDPGTRLGENFLYTYDGLIKAIHDWNGGDVLHGPKVIVIVTPRKS